MPRIKVNFTNAQNLTLSGLLETPQDKPIVRYALFAHCFTCGKDVAAASRISRALAKQGIAVLRFDFTGLGNSDGDFANTNFTSNVDDLIAAAQMLEAEYEAPSMLIGHSLGGAAVLSAASRLPSVKAIATIGAPATASHVKHLFSGAEPALREQGTAEVRIGMRSFNIKRQLLDDLEQYTSQAYLSTLNAALLVFHSPVDTIVSIDEAAHIYKSANHPKSFISLDDADHMLSNRDDAEYVALTLSAWASRYLKPSANVNEQPTRTAPDVARGEVLITEKNHDFLRGMFSDSHQLLADEPVRFGGSNLGPTPYELLLMSLGSCTSMTLRMYARHKNMPLDDVQVRLVHERVHAEDCSDCDNRTGEIERITRYLSVKGDLSEKDRKSLLRIANRCPVHITLENEPEIVTAFEDE